jgi:hypothetical protein
VVILIGATRKWTERLLGAGGAKIPKPILQTSVFVLHSTTLSLLNESLLDGYLRPFTSSTN